MIIKPQLKTNGVKLGLKRLNHKDLSGLKGNSCTLLQCCGRMETVAKEMERSAEKEEPNEKVRVKLHCEHDDSSLGISQPTEPTFR